MTSTFSQVWKRIVGDPDKFPLETRIFHAFAFFTSISVICNIPFKFMLSLPGTALLALILAFLMIYSYYCSRCINKTGLGRTIAAISTSLILGLNYIFNDGINGSATLQLTFTYFAVVCVTPPKEFKLWITVNLLILSVLIATEYFYPHVVQQHYNSRTYRFLDIYFSYLIVIFLAALTIPYLIKSYNTERQSAEQKAALLKVANEEREKLFSIIGHDLRAPLANIQNYLDILSDIDLSGQERLSIQAKLLSSTKSTLSLLNNLLHWSKGQMPGSKIQLSPINVYELLAPQLNLSANIAAQKKISLDVSIDHAIQVIGNSDMLQVIIRNLVDNAIKFTSPKGRIAVATKMRKDKCIISVRDSGNGQLANLSPDIFQLNGTTTAGTANERGTGLGLVLCKEFTEAQNGRIWFGCDPISGTNFYVELPLYEAIQQESKELQHLK